jgi:hypothetical protein
MLPSVWKGLIPVLISGKLLKMANLDVYLVSYIFNISCGDDPCLLLPFTAIRFTAYIQFH